MSPSAAAIWLAFFVTSRTSSGLLQRVTLRGICDLYDLTLTSPGPYHTPCQDIFYFTDFV
jgi:hypothetical protein